jgi:predicted phage terminase large subunit-like protein
MTKKTSKLDWQQWQDFRNSIKEATPVDITETAAARQKRVAELEKKPQEWKAYYFPKYLSAPSPKFHTVASKRLHKNFAQNKHYYEVRHWFRGSAKTTTAMFDVLYLVLTGKLHNIIYTSSTYDAAEAFLEKYRAELDSNARIINDYGAQASDGSWTAGDFTTRAEVRFLAIGAGQSPRGNSNKNFRVDGIIVDDFDTDEECRNPEIIKKKWKWFEEALLPTIDVAKPYLVLWLGNIIAQDCCVYRAGLVADHTETINIRDADGKSTWHEKNSEADIDYLLSKMSYSAAQKELFNNPIVEGSVFKEMHFKPIRLLKDYSILLCYTDPSFRETQKADYKATVLVGKYRDEYHVLKAYVEQTSTENMVKWLYAIYEYAAGLPCYFYIEQGFIQDIILKQIFEISKRERYNITLPIQGDERKKQDKFARIESLLQPLNNNGQLFLNDAERDNPHMRRLIDQFTAFGPGSRAHDDAPDAVEGAVFLINQKSVAQQGGIKLIPRHKSSKHI